MSVSFQKLSQVNPFQQRDALREAAGHNFSEQELSQLKKKANEKLDASLADLHNINDSVLTSNKKKAAQLKQVIDQQSQTFEIAEKIVKNLQNRNSGSSPTTSSGLTQSTNGFRHSPNRQPMTQSGRSGSLGFSPGSNLKAPPAFMKSAQSPAGLRQSSAPSLTPTPAFMKTADRSQNTFTPTGNRGADSLVNTGNSRSAGGLTNTVNPNNVGFSNTGVNGNPGGFTKVGTGIKDKLSEWGDKGTNTEEHVIDELNGAMEAYAEQLEALFAWTEGGTSVISGALAIMMESITARDGFPSNCDMEDLFQIVLLDMMSNPQDYPGMEALLNDPKFMLYASYILQYTGSGSHQYPDALGGDTTILGDAYEYMYSMMYDIAMQNPGSVAYEAFMLLEQHGGEQRLHDQMDYDQYYSDSDGFISYDPNQDPPAGENYPPPDATDLSPFMTLIVLGMAAQDPNSGVTPEVWDDILSMDLETIDDIIDPNDQHNTIFDYLASMDSANWEITPEGDWDFKGTAGDPADYVGDVFEDFPPRDLTEEEIEEINRIGDDTKILLETLKHWMKTLGDSKSQIAANL